MEDKKTTYAADTVDAGGKAWETVGENIRNGNNINVDALTEQIVNTLFPVGSEFLGVNRKVTSVGKWSAYDVYVTVYSYDDPDDTWTLSNTLWYRTA